MVDSAALLDRAPEVVRRFAYRTAAGQGLAGRLADAIRFRYTEAEVPRLPALAEEPIRLLIGPADSAGQGYQWARAAERNISGVHAIAMRGIGADPFQLEVDLRVPVGVYQRAESWHSAFEEFLSNQTHVIWESGLPLLGRRWESAPGAEMSLLGGRGVHEALLFHGSDIRPPSGHAAQNPWSPFHRMPGASRALEATAAANARLVAESGVPVFVSTPDLLQWLPESIWCPVVIDPVQWVRAGSPQSSSVPVVVHAPSQKWLKGTDAVEPMLRRLDGEGVIEYRQIVGVPHASMPDIYADADIVLDQFVLGIYGVAACEAMASGRLVMSHVDEFTRNTVLERTGLALPVHEATIQTLEAELRRAAAEPEAFEGLRTAGPAFVDAVHDGRRSAHAMAAFLGVRA